MQTNNPFDLILSRLDQLQTTVNVLTDKANNTPTVPISNPDRLLDLSEAAEVLRKPIGTVRYYIHHRNLPATKVGKSYLVKAAEILKWFEEFSQQSPGKKGVNRMLEQRKRYRKS
jgi:excisionase family DNA binding protein